MRMPFAIACAIACSCARGLAQSEPDAPGTLKVFLLAGQSNMQGQAVVDLDHEEHYNGGRGTLVRVLEEPDLLERFGHVRDERGGWVERDDVWVWYRRRDEELEVGPLSVGFAAYTGRHHFGPELVLGHALGEHFDEPVLLVKTAWGGQSLHRDFRPPGAGGVTGPRFTQMLAEYREAVGAIGDHVPAAASLTPELVGFVWFQGWNDMIDAEATRAYEDNLVHLVLDVRRELDAPGLPVVIAETGNCGNSALREAQRAAADRAELGGSSRFVETGAFLRRPEDSPNRTHGHHWFGNAASYLEIGAAMAEAMLELLDD